MVLRTASITPDQAANYLVEAVPGLVKRDDAPAGRAVVTGAGGIALELRAAATREMKVMMDHPRR